MSNDKKLSFDVTCCLWHVVVDIRARLAKCSKSIQYMESGDVCISKALHSG